MKRPKGISTSGLFTFLMHLHICTGLICLSLGSIIIGVSQLTYVGAVTIEKFIFIAWPCKKLQGFFCLLLSLHIFPLQRLFFGNITVGMVYNVIRSSEMEQ